MSSPCGHLKTPCPTVRSTLPLLSSTTIGCAPRVNKNTVSLRSTPTAVTSPSSTSAGSLAQPGTTWYRKLLSPSTGSSLRWVFTTGHAPAGHSSAGPHESPIDTRQIRTPGQPHGTHEFRPQDVECLRHPFLTADA